MIKHLGVDIIQKKHGLKLTRENYAEINNKSSLPKFSVDIYTDESGKFYAEEWCQQQYIDVMTNYDLNMNFFSSLDRMRFSDEIVHFLIKNKEFSEVSDLNRLNEKAGFYVMILDEYCQVYIGVSKNIYRRIRAHWNARKPFDRLLLPMGNVESSRISIDSFGALDTTRLFAFTIDDIEDFEDFYISQIPDQFCINRIAGGLTSLAQALAFMKSRVLK
jgi:hypothetical protein